MSNDSKPFDISDIADISVKQNAFDINEEVKTLLNNMNYLKSLSVEEFTFRKKWEEITDWTSMKGHLNMAGEAKAKIWSPIDVNDEALTVKEIENLNPTIVLIKNPEDDRMWTTLRYFCSSAEFNQAPGRFVKFWITDGNLENPRILGLSSIASDVISISDRDKYIGWTLDNRLKDKNLEHSAIGTTIVSTQPFGYNFLGGKLTAALVVSNTVRESWKKLYDNVLVGMTTTSLYGSYSMYNSLKWWHKCGSSTGKILIKPDEIIYKKWHDWVKKTRSQEYEQKMTQKEGVSGPVTGAKLRVLNMIFESAGLKQSNFTHGFERGVYYSCFYENTKEFLSNKISEKDLILKPLFHQDTKGIMEWWKPKAIERYKRLLKENNIKSEKLFYSNMNKMNYEQAKFHYFNDVGR